MSNMGKLTRLYRYLLVRWHPHDVHILTQAYIDALDDYPFDLQDAAGVGMWLCFMASD